MWSGLLKAITRTGVSIFITSDMLTQGTVNINLNGDIVRSMNNGNSKQLLVIAYPQDWHWALSVEYILAESTKNQKFHVLDLSYPGQLELRSFLRWVLGGNRLRKTGLKLLEHNQNAKILKSQVFFSSICAFIDSTIEMTTLEPTLNFQNSTTIYNSCVEKSGNLNPATRKNFGTIFKEVFARNLTRRILENLDYSRYGRVVTVNGRFTKNAVVKEWASSKSLPCRLIEFGASKESFQIYEVSPHSMSELEGKVNEFWENAEDSFRQRVGREYLTKLSVDKPITEINWRAKMQRNLIPPKEKPNSCVFFTSTEAEYAGVGDFVQASNYQNQVQAFRAIVKELPVDEWQIFLRRHPDNPRGEVKDAEHLLWDEFKKFSNVFIIEPESPVDSIALGMSADLAVNYCSIIAIELVARGAQNVITMGPSPWQGLLPQRQIETNFTLAGTLELMKERVEPERILPLCFYLSNHGISFQETRYLEAENNWRHST